jgi:hypothetical protein
MKPRLLVCLGLMGLSGCQAVPVTPEAMPPVACRYPERDLTVPWAQRVYWCRPDRPVAPEIPFCVGDACG